MAAARIGQHFGRAGTPNDQAWIESFFGHLKVENPHLDEIDDPAVLRAELEHLHTTTTPCGCTKASATSPPDDEHEGRGSAIRTARKEGLQRAREARVATRRQNRENRNNNASTDEGI